MHTWKAPEALYHDPDLARFYDMRTEARDDFDCCARLAQNAGSVLDLGCGTGALAARLGAGRAVTGVDPAAAMLAIARRRPGAERVEWIEEDARSVRLGRRFDLVVMTGHSFQVFLSEEDQCAVLSTIAAHLAPDGRFVFDSRNPDFPERKTRSREETLRRAEHAQLGSVDAWNESTYCEDTGILTYENGYRVVETGAVFSARARIRYTRRDVLAHLLASSGLVAERWLGDWLGNAFHPAAREIIPLGRLVRGDQTSPGSENSASRA